MNTLKVIGTQSLLEVFYEQNKGKAENHLSFHNSLPLQNILKSKSYYDIEIEDESFEDEETELLAVEEAMKVWGCKWDTKCYEFKKEMQHLVYEEFVTPLNPPIQWIIKVSEMNPSLTFHLSAISIEDDVQVKGEWVKGIQHSFMREPYSKLMYEQDDGDKIRDLVIKILKKDLITIQDLLDTKLTFFQWLEKDTNKLKNSILSLLDEVEAYDYIDYLFMKIKEKLVSK
jgi:hypothetical protein